MTNIQSHPSYVPDDARIAVSSLEFLRSDEGRRLLAAVRDLIAIRAAPTVADVGSFRKTHSAAHVHAAFALAQLQLKAVGPTGKFPTLDFLWCVPEALEQATDSAVARHKASRFAAAGGGDVSHIFDLCAGVGGDTFALANVAPVTAIDLSPVRTLCLQWNVEAAAPRFPITVRTEDIRKSLLTPAPPGTAFHIDPSRRSEGKRSPRYEYLIPGPPILAEVIRHFPGGGAIKLSSAVDFDSLPPGHLELITHHRTVVQAVLWTGNLAASFPPTTRTATILKDKTFSFTAEPRQVPFLAGAGLSPTQLPPYLYEVDGSLTRASLAAPFAESLHLSALTPDGGYLHGPTLLDHPALTPFSVLAALPYSEQRVTDALKHLGGETGPVEVKTRGNVPSIDTDHLQRLWTKTAPHRRTVFIFRHAKDILAIIAQRLP